MMEYQKPATLAELQPLVLTDGTEYRAVKEEDANRSNSYTDFLAQLSQAGWSLYHGKTNKRFRWLSRERATSWVKKSGGDFLPLLPHRLHKGTVINGAELPSDDYLIILGLAHIPTKRVYWIREPGMLMHHPHTAPVDKTGPVDVDLGAGDVVANANDVPTVEGKLRQFNGGL